MKKWPLLFAGRAIASKKVVLTQSLLPLFFRANLIREPVVIVDLFALANGANGAKNARGTIAVSATRDENAE